MTGCAATLSYAYARACPSVVIAPNARGMATVAVDSWVPGVI